MSSPVSVGEIGVVAAERNLSVVFVLIYDRAE
jgi:hypothetical protein